MYGYETVGLYNFAVARLDLPASLAYEIVKGVFDHHEEMLEVHPAAASTVPRTSFTIPSCRIMLVQSDTMAIPLRPVSFQGTERREPQVGGFLNLVVAFVPLLESAGRCWRSQELIGHGGSRRLHRDQDAHPGRDADHRRAKAPMIRRRAAVGMSCSTRIRQPSAGRSRPARARRHAATADAKAGGDGRTVIDRERTKPGAPNRSATSIPSRTWRRQRCSGLRCSPARSAPSPTPPSAR